MPACKKLLSLAITLVVLFGSCASAISVDSRHILDYLFTNVIDKINLDCKYNYSNGLYVYNTFEDEENVLKLAFSAPKSNERIMWGVAKRGLINDCTECKAILDKEGRTNESVIIAVTYTIPITSSITPVYLPLLIIKDGVVIFDISDTVPPVQ
ncbi:MAG: hypothetical protein RSE58_08595 [Clostridia bacterium]